jgi:hypothetical protein
LPDSPLLLLFLRLSFAIMRSNTPHRLWQYTSARPANPSGPSAILAGEIAPAGWQSTVSQHWNLSRLNW